MTERRRRVEQGLVCSPEARASHSSQSFVTDRMALYNVPGMSVAVIDEGEVAWTAAYGLAAADENRIVDGRTLFQCCSTSKMVAALVALRLVMEDRLALDAPVNEILVDWKLCNSGGEEQPTTLRQLLSHTGGVNVHGAPGYPPESLVSTLMEVLEGRLPAITAPVLVTSEAGNAFRYSGGGFCVIQKVIETVTGSSFAQAARELVLAPLGMFDSTFEQPLPTDLESRAAAAHMTLAPHPAHERWFVYPEQAAGGLWTTATDLARVVLEIQAAPRGEGQVLSESLVGEMTTVHTSNWNAGLGTFMSNADSPESAFFSHTGAHLGWHAVAMGYLHLGKGAVVLTNNGYTGSELYREFLLSVANEYAWPNFNGSFR